MIKIEEKGYVKFGRAIADYWKGYLSFKGKTTRSGFWLAQVLNRVILTGISLLLLFLIICYFMQCAWIYFGIFNQYIFSFTIIMMVISVVLLIIWRIITFIPDKTLYCRRLQDLGLSYKVSLIIIIFYAIFELSIASLIFFNDKYCIAFILVLYISLIINLLFRLVLDVLSAFDSDIFISKSTNPKTTEEVNQDQIDIEISSLHD